jgi:predicted RNase H-like HicB family nuclease
MNSARYIYWEDDGDWLGYFEEYPDYWTQGKSLEDLQEHLKDLFRDLTGGEIPGVRRVAELSVL